MAGWRSTASGSADLDRLRVVVERRGAVGPLPAAGQIAQQAQRPGSHVRPVLAPLDGGLRGGDGLVVAIGLLEDLRERDVVAGVVLLQLDRPSGRRQRLGRLAHGRQHPARSQWAAAEFRRQLDGLVEVPEVHARVGGPGWSPPEG